MRHQPPRTLLSLLSLLLLLPLTSASERCPVVLQPSSRAPRIIGGDLASNFSVTFTASLIQAFASACTGSLLSARWVLTARHCLPSDATFVFLGGRDRATGALVPVRRVHLYDGVDERDDIALLELAASAPDNSTFVRINVDATKPIPGAFVRSIGYGSTSYAGPTNRLLREVDAPVVSTDTCQAEYNEEGVLELDERTLCAGYDRGRCGVCSGDSGGPLVQFDKEGRPVQVGIASRSRGCAWAGVPAIFTRVSAFVAWMEDVGAEFEGADDAVQDIGQGEETTPVEQEAGNRGDEDGGLPRWVIGLLTGGPLLAFVVVAAAVITNGKIARNRERRAQNAGDAIGEGRQGREGSLETPARGGVVEGGAEVEGAEDV